MTRLIQLGLKYWINRAVMHYSLQVTFVVKRIWEVSVVLPWDSCLIHGPLQLLGFPADATLRCVFCREVLWNTYWSQDVFVISGNAAIRPLIKCVTSKTEKSIMKSHRLGEGGLQAGALYRGWGGLFPSCLYLKNKKVNNIWVWNKNDPVLCFCWAVIPILPFSYTFVNVFWVLMVVHWNLASGSSTSALW